jgi:hypothetical protein
VSGSTPASNPRLTSDANKNEDSSSEDTCMTGNKTTTRRRIKQVHHLEVEFKKIKPFTFYGESRKGEEAEAWLLDIKKYF